MNWLDLNDKWFAKVRRPIGWTCLIVSVFELFARWHMSTLLLGCLCSLLYLWPTFKPPQFEGVVNLSLLEGEKEAQP